ncbi:MAG: right-handed parallel beta-helix repeat-containing protein [Planctomycetota bacterium]|jgi:hypothetical protein
MRYIILPLILGTVILPAVGSSATIHVPGDYATIQEAIDATEPGDIVLVAPGTYVENIDFKGKAITVKSSNGPAATVIDGGNPAIPEKASVVTFSTGEGADSVLEGFTLKNGEGTETKSIEYTWGGGVYCDGASPTITGNVFQHNVVGYGGGGIFCTHDSCPKITLNYFVDNSAEFEGSGICCRYDSHAEIQSDHRHRGLASFPSRHGKRRHR